MKITMSAAGTVLQIVWVLDHQEQVCAAEGTDGYKNPTYYKLWCAPLSKCSFFGLTSAEFDCEVCQGLRVGKGCAAPSYLGTPRWIEGVVDQAFLVSDRDQFVRTRC